MCVCVLLLEKLLHQITNGLIKQGNVGKRNALNYSECYTDDNVCLMEHCRYSGYLHVPSSSTAVSLYLLIKLLNSLSALSATLHVLGII